MALPWWDFLWCWRRGDNWQGLYGTNWRNSSPNQMRKQLFSINAMTLFLRTMINHGPMNLSVWLFERDIYGRVVSMMIRHVQLDRQPFEYIREVGDLPASNITFMMEGAEVHQQTLKIFRKYRMMIFFQQTYWFGAREAKIKVNWKSQVAARGLLPWLVCR